MEWVETTGRTTEEAKDHALDQLGVDESDAEFEILEEPRPGLFGRIRGEARVRARVRPTAPRPKVERRDRRDRRSKDKSRSADTAPPRTNGEDRPADAEGADDGDRAETAFPREPAPARTRSMTPPPEETTMSNGEHSPEEVAEDATAFVVGLLDAFGLDGTVAASQPADGEIEIAVEGEGLGLLVGPKGQTLLAIQDLTRLVAQRHVGPGSPRLGVDVGGYRQRRVEALRRFSLQVAEQVVETGLPKTLEPMAAADRKVVHDALTDVTGVSTLSEGEEPYRRVVIVPEAVGG
jgi:spoIIIJ-associated protein